METRTASKQVTFVRAFQLAALEGLQPPGIYTIDVEEEALDSFSFAGWRQTRVTLRLTRGGTIEYVAIDPQDLREAQLRDGDQSNDPPAAPGVAQAQNPHVRENLRLRAICQ